MRRRRPPRGHDRLRPRPRVRRPAHLRAHAAHRRRASRTCRSSRDTTRRHRPAPARRPARLARVDDVSGHDRRGGAADPRATSGLQGRARTSFSPSRPSARTRATASFNTANIPKVVGGVSRDCLEAAVRRCTARRSSTVVPVSLDARRRDDQAPREHLPLRQHRARQRAEDALRPDGHRHLGGDRRGQDQAVRLHALLSRARPRRPLHPDRPVLPHLEGARVRAWPRASSSWPARSTTACRTTSSTGCRTRSNSRRKSLNGPSVLILGVAYKPNIDDMRESPAIKVAELLSDQRGRRRLPRPVRAEFQVGGVSVPVRRLTAEEWLHLDVGGRRHRPRDRGLRAGGREEQARPRHPKCTQGLRGRQGGASVA